MKRTHYRNGEPISLSCGCNDCTPMSINGVLCHEGGCPSAYKDYAVSCFECGFEFYPTERNQRMCQDCLNPEDHDHLDDLDSEAELDLEDFDEEDYDDPYDEYENEYDDANLADEAEADRAAMEEDLSKPDPFDPE